MPSSWLIILLVVSIYSPISHGFVPWTAKVDNGFRQQRRSFTQSNFHGRNIIPKYYGANYNNNQKKTLSSSLLMGMKVTIRIVGKGNKKTGSSEKWIEEGCSMYQKRMRSSNIELDTEWHKNNESLIKGVQGDRNKKKDGGSSSGGTKVVLLDPNLGKIPKSSEEFSEDFYNWLELGGSRLVFVIGGAEGLPRELLNGQGKQQQQQNTLLSLSPLTFTHQFARLLLIEQIYRATEIRKGSSYHK